MSDTEKPHILIVEARFYDDMADALLDGATSALKEAGATYDVVTVPGALEIPAAIAMALDGADNGGTEYDGFVALGMVIRGETYHFDIVANESSRALMDLAVSESLAIGNGILTVENDDAGLGARQEERRRQGRFCRPRGADHDRPEKQAGRRTVSDIPSDPPIKQANQRGAARLAAVQALYQMDVGGTGVLEIVAEYEAHRLGQELDGETYLKADASWFRSIVSGVVRDQRLLDPLIGTALQDDWALSRLDSTVRAILRAGTFELLERKDVPVAVIVTEYVEIAKAFFEDDEPKLVNAVLDRIARTIRTDVKK